MRQRQGLRVFDNFLGPRLGKHSSVCVCSEPVSEGR